MAQLVTNPPAVRETRVRSLGWEDPLEKEKATHSSMLAGEFHGLYSPWGCKELDMTEQLSLFSCLLGQEDPLEKGMATHSSILAWKIPQTEEPGGLQSMGSKSQT